MNHRELISVIDINRSVLPDIYTYKNWNNAAVKGNLIISSDSILVYGNIGIWLTDSSFREYTSFNSGFQKGSDNRKIFDVHQTADGNLYAATLFGLYSFSDNLKEWKEFRLNTDIDRFTAIESIGDTLYVINRSNLFKGKSEGINTVFEEIEIPAPEGYTYKVSLFETIWQIHSGEIFGLPGKIYVDILGVITIFLSSTGIIYFFFPGWIKRRSKSQKSSTRIARANRWSLKWHNKIGEWIFGFLILLFFTGMFLRPPLLIAIADANIAPLKYSHLDHPNPWYDKLRDILYVEERDEFFLSTSDGIFFMRRDDLKPKRFEFQPPVSVMGINTLEKSGTGSFLIGSFSGLFLWNPESPEINNFITGTLYHDNSGGRPIGDFKVSGTIKDTQGRQYMSDYDLGMIALRHDGKFPEMPENVREESKMSLWNVSLEIHTGRIFQGMTGGFYILIVPLTGLTAIIVVLSGYLMWRRKYKNKVKPL